MAYARQAATIIVTAIALNGIVEVDCSACIVNTRLSIFVRMHGDGCRLTTEANGDRIGIVKWSGNFMERDHHELVGGGAEKE
jgi:hypothetical protein